MMNCEGDIRHFVTGGYPVAKCFFVIDIRQSVPDLVISCLILPERKELSSVYLELG